MNYAWTLCVALIGSAIAVKLKVPAGALIGALIAVGGVNCLQLFEVPAPPQGTKFILQMGLGILLGATITSDTLANLQDYNSCGGQRCFAPPLRFSQALPPVSQSPVGWVWSS